MLRKSEIQLLQELKTEKSIKGIATALNKSQSRISQIVSNLEQEKLVNTRRKAKKKLVSPSQAKSVEILQQINQKYPHINTSKILSGKNIQILYYLNKPLKVTEIAEKTDNYRNTVNRILKKLRNQGMVNKDGKNYKLNPEFKILNKFAREYIHHSHRQFLSQHTEKYIILWESTSEILFQTQQTIDTDLFQLTGPEKFRDYSIPLLTTGKKYYFYNKEKENISPEELICHTLKINSSTRYQSYCLLLIKKHEISYDKLREHGEKYGLTETIEHLINYIETGGEEKTGKLPDWNEFQDLLNEYREPATTASI